MNNIDSRRYQINDEIRINKDIKGIIRYIGPVETDKNENNNEDWVGIELKEPKGKHNGIFNGRRYFECKDNHGIFIKLNKLKNSSAEENELNTSAFLESMVYSPFDKEKENLLRSREGRYKKKFEQEVLQKEAQKGFYLKMIKNLKYKVNRLESQCKSIGKNHKKKIIKTIDILLKEVNLIIENIDFVISKQSCLVWDPDTLRVRELLRILINKIFDGEKYEIELVEYKMLLAKEGIFINEEQL